MTNQNNMNLATQTRAIELLKEILLQYKRFIKINREVLKDTSLNRTINPSMTEQLMDLWNIIYNNVEENIWVFNTSTTNTTILELRYELRLQEQKLAIISTKIQARAERYYRMH